MFLHDYFLLYSFFLLLSLLPLPREFRDLQHFDEFHLFDQWCVGGKALLRLFHDFSIGLFQHSSLGDPGVPCPSTKVVKNTWDDFFGEEA